MKYLTPDEQEDVATQLFATALHENARLVAPSSTWAEVGSVLRKKVRARLLDVEEADVLWHAFLRLPFEFADTHALRERAWEIAEEYGLPTLYNAVFLACTELAPASESTRREFWTADETLLRLLGTRKPAYVRQLL